MQNRNAIKIFTILFAIVCVYQLSFTLVADRVEEDAIEYASQFDIDEQESKEKFYLDSKTINFRIWLEFVWYLITIKSQFEPRKNI